MVIIIIMPIIIPFIINTAMNKLTKDIAILKEPKKKVHYVAGT